MSSYQNATHWLGLLDTVHGYIWCASGNTATVGLVLSELKLYTICYGLILFSWGYNHNNSLVIIGSAFIYPSEQLLLIMHFYGLILCAMHCDVENCSILDHDAAPIICL